MSDKDRIMRIETLLLKQFAEIFSLNMTGIDDSSLNDLDVLGRFVFVLQPSRCLEFGTWAGESALECLKNSNATVWTINKLFGEYRVNGDSAYSNVPGDAEIIAWAEKMHIHGDRHGYYKTDAIGFVGRKYLEANYGHRVCQIYCDSEAWDTSNYPNGFFDTVFIDGGHKKETVLCDTRKAFPLLRSGGVMIWHDYLPIKGVCESSDGVIDAIEELDDWLNDKFSRLVWIKDTMLLIGIKI